VIKKIVATALLAILCGCSSIPPLNTPSGNPEVTYNADRAVVSDVIASWMVGRGYALDDQSERIIRGRKNAGDTAEMLYGQSEVILTISILNAGQGKTKAIANIQLESKSGFSTKRKDFSKGTKDAHVIQSELEKLKYQIEK